MGRRTRTIAEREQTTKYNKETVMEEKKNDMKEESIEKEIKMLRELQSMHRRPFMQDEWDRLQFLLKLKYEGKNSVSKENLHTEIDYQRPLISSLLGTANNKIEK